MKKSTALFSLATLALAGVASAAVAEADCLTGSYGAGITVAYTNGKCVATFDSTGHNTDFNLNGKNLVVDSVRYIRYNTASKSAQTIVLPFTMSGCTATNLNKIGKLTQIKNDDSKGWTGYVKTSISDVNTLSANTPYIFTFANTDNAKVGEIDFGGSGCQITFVSSDETPKVSLDATAKDNKTKIGTWDFIGTFQQKIFSQDEVSNGYFYGFASKSTVNASGDTIKVGQFVKAGNGSSVPPLRAYLVFNKTTSSTPSNAPAFMMAPAADSAVASIDAEDLPTSIEVVFEDEEGTDAIGTLNARTGEITLIKEKDLWVDMKGRKSNKKPTAKGTYYNQGKKVIIK